MSNTLSDLDIARANKTLPISEVAAGLGIPLKDLIPYGHDKAKISYDFLENLGHRPDGKLILVTAISPTPAGEGKTTTTIGLGDGLNDRQEGHHLPARTLPRPLLRHERRRRRRRLCPSRAHGGYQPPFHR